MFNREDLQFRDYCISNNILTEDRWKQFVDTATNYGINEGFSKALIQFKFFSPDELVQHLGKTFTLPVMKLYAETSSAPREILSITFIRKHRVIPMFLFGNELTVAFVDPPYKNVLDELAKLTKMKIVPVISDVNDFDETLKIQQGGFDELERIASAIDIQKFDVVRTGEKEVERLEKIGEFPPMIELVDEIFLRAIKIGASDIHVEPFEEELRLRFRLDGVLQRVASFPKKISEGMAAVIKTKADMDIFEKKETSRWSYLFDA